MLDICMIIYLLNTLAQDQIGLTNSREYVIVGVPPTISMHKTFLS